MKKLHQHNSYTLQNARYQVRYVGMDSMWRAQIQMMEITKTPQTAQRKKTLEFYRSIDPGNLSLLIMLIYLNHDLPQSISSTIRQCFSWVETRCASSNMKTVKVFWYDEFSLLNKYLLFDTTPRHSLPRMPRPLQKRHSSLIPDHIQAKLLFHRPLKEYYYYLFSQFNLRKKQK